ncbi:MAG: hypothetical protein OFPI_37420 [Osedax symbiont Rs2]|nr:MAG: hypothetical protein OFPI_37420 [Osedax symbiont Rs2]
MQSVDVLGDVLRVLRLRGSLYFDACFCAPWGMQVSSSSQASFHIIVKGEAWLKLDSQAEPIKLQAGDIVLFPTSAGHSISDRLDSQCLQGEAVVQAYQNQQPLFAGSPADSHQPKCNIICGYVEFDRALSHPFLTNLPDFIHVDGQMRSRFKWLDSAIEQIVLETSVQQPGGAVLIDRFTEILFIQMIRSYAQLNLQQQSYFSALLDDQLSTALSLMHNAPDRDWSVELLASKVGMSRSVFYGRFNDHIGIPPMKYLFEWRMLQAKQKIQNSHKSLSLVAEEVGYQSDSAFQKAFKRFFSYTPASLRKKTNSTRDGG